MNAAKLLACISAFFCAMLAMTAVLRRPRSTARWLFGGGMLALCFGSIFTGLSFGASLAEKVYLWQQRAMIVRSFLPVIWLSFSLVYSRGNSREFLLRWRWVIILLLVSPITLGLVANEGIFILPSDSGPVDSLRFSFAGEVLNVIGMCGMVLIVMNLEKTFRTAVGTMRWRIKFVILGLAVIFGAEFYVGSQALLYSGLRLSIVPVESAALIIGCALICVSYFRSDVLEIDVYPSHGFIFSSVTVLLAGVYLVSIGFLVRVVLVVGGVTFLPLNAFLVLLGTAGLAILLVSDRFRQRVHHFVSRHFKRPLYDHRKVWNLFTENAAQVSDDVALCKTVAKLVSDTFDVLSVTFWLVEERENKLRLVASTALRSEHATDRLELTSDHALMFKALREEPRPFDLEQSKAVWSEDLRKCNPVAFRAGGNRLCVPIVAGGRVLGIFVAGDRVNGLPFTLEEFDLIRCIGNHVAASLSIIQLSERLLATKEQEAFKAMSAFFAHDLKNAASTLTLMLQNLPQHFENPAFREDVLRGIAKIVQHMNYLIGRLSVLRQGPELQCTLVDLNNVVDNALKQWESLPGIDLVKELKPIPKLLLDSTQIQNVITNLMLNARDAVAGSGSIRIQTTSENGWAVIILSDNGCGMTPEFLRRSLFRPFQTTKKDGTGIGMFQCKMIVEAHQGKIEVESQSGKGTICRVQLPLPKSK